MSVIFNVYTTWWKMGIKNRGEVKLHVWEDSQTDRETGKVKKNVEGQEAKWSIHRKNRVLSRFLFLLLSDSHSPYRLASVERARRASNSHFSFPSTGIFMLKTWGMWNRKHDIRSRRKERREGGISMYRFHPQLIMHEFSVHTAVLTQFSRRKTISFREESER